MANYQQRAVVVKRNISTGSYRLPQPLAKLWYFDKIRIWLQRRLPEWRIVWLRKHCRRRLYEKKRRKPWDPRYVMGLELYQPDDEALQYLATLDGVLLNYVECALDWTFSNKQQVDEAYEFVRSFHIKLWHREQWVVFYRGTTRYTAKQGVANLLVVYSDLLCRRLTEPTPCVHLEWRLNGARALQRAGLGTVGQLLQLDHRAFWQKRLLMHTVDQQALGHHYNRHVLGRGRRGRPWIEYYGPGLAYDFDGRSGYMLMRRAGGSTQSVVDLCRKQFDVAQCLQRLDVDELLPNERLDVEQFLPAVTGSENDCRGVELDQGNQWVRYP
jgi:hypothetical protein